MRSSKQTEKKDDKSSAFVPFLNAVRMKITEAK